MYTLPDLPYAYDALNEYIDEQTMTIHHTKHHQGYINKLNAALEGSDTDMSLEEMLKNLSSLSENISSSVQNNGGGHYNHSLFWTVMTPGGKEASGEFMEKLNATFGSFDQFKEEFEAAAKTRFGSGWAWLVRNEAGELSVMSTANQDNPLSHGFWPILGLDVWEHAYYLKYQNKRPDYVQAWWNVVNWEQVEANYNQLFNVK